MEVKVLCDCGQKYAFEVTPIAGRMPVMVNCPACGANGTAAANAIIARFLAENPAAAPPPPPPPPITRVHAAAPPAPPPTAAPAPAAGMHVHSSQQTASASLGRGVAGAALGALGGAGALYGFAILTGFRFPLLGVAIGLLTGYGAKLIGKDTSQRLGILSAILSFLAVMGTLYLMYGTVPLMSLISAIVAASFAHQIASR